jgi:hypothetical protein
MAYNLTLISGMKPSVFSIVVRYQRKAKRPYRHLGPPHLPFHGTGGFFLGIKRPKREANHSSLYSVEVKNEWHYTDIPNMSL